MRELAVIGLALVFFVIVTIASFTIRYNYCRKAGFSHDECVYQTACN